jgi:hypothetical protein
MTSEPDTIPYAGTCPPWCADCTRENEADGFVIHHSPACLTTVYTEDDGPLPATVRASHFDQHPAEMDRPPTDLNRPMIDIAVHDNIACLQLTPAQARHLAGLLTTIADTVDPPDAT